MDKNVKAFTNVQKIAKNKQKNANKFKNAFNTNKIIMDGVWIVKTFLHL